MLSSGTFLLAFPYTLGGQIARRKRWQEERRWEACGERCNVREPSLSPSLYTLVPGAVLSIGGFWFLAQNWLVESGDSGDGENDSSGADPASIMIAASAACLGTTLLATGIVHLVARQSLHAAWVRHGGVPTSARIQPTFAMTARGAGGFGFGLALNGRY